MAYCVLCGAFCVSDDAYDCNGCKKYYYADLDAGRLPPPLTDKRDLTLELWVKVRCLERDLSKEGVSKEQIRAKVIEYVSPYVGRYERQQQADQKLRDEIQARQNAIRDNYSY